MKFAASTIVPYLLLFPLLAACSQLPGLATPTRPPVTVVAPVGSDTRIAGVVRHNYLGCEVDNLCLLEVDVGPGVVNVIYHFGESEQRCENTAVFDRAAALQRGDRVEVYARVLPGGALSVCGAQRYDIKRIP